MKRIQSITRRAFPAALFIVSFFPRAIQPVSRPLVWYLRSAHFIRAVLAGDFANTVYSEHPGVALMWPVGVGLKLYWLLSGITPAADSVPADFEPIHFFGPVPVAEIAAALLPLALLIALGIVAIYFLLRRLFGDEVAIVASLLLSISPYHLTQSKVLHLDAWLTVLMLLSALTLMLHGRQQRARWLVLSGTLGGLALLVKSAALFLVPFAGLVLLVYAVRHTKHATAITHSLLHILLLPLVAWLLIAALVYVALWPAMWVAPGRALAAVKWGLTQHTATAHDSPTYFMGQITRHDPGPIFYLVSLALRTGELTLLFCPVAAIFGVVYLLRRRRLAHAGVDYLLLLAYAVFFLAQMSLSAKKMPRYTLPAITALVVLAAAGLVAWARALAGPRRAWVFVLIALPLLAQAALVLPRHPYYGTAFNWIAGGPQAAARAILIAEEGEGLADLAADLNARTDAQQLIVAAQLKHVFNQYFIGTTLNIDQRPADHLVFHRNYTMRDYKLAQWQDAWERYAARTPDQEIVFDGVPYAQRYAVLDDQAQPEHGMDVRLGSRYRFLGYDLRATEVSPGDRVPLVLYWQASQASEDDLSIFLHLLGPAGELIWQDDGAANHGARPTWSWGAGEMIVDPHTLLLPRDLPEGEYALVTGLYDWRTGERLDVEPSQAADQISVTTLSVRQPGAHPAAWVARAVAGGVVLSALAAAVSAPVVAWRSHRDE